MTKFRIYSLPMCIVVLCCVSMVVNAAPEEWARKRRQDELSISSTSTTAESTTSSTTPSSIITPINPKAKSKKVSNLSKNASTTTMRKRIKLENVNITAMVDMDKIELTPEFLENTMNEYVELSKAIYDEAPNEAVRERRTLAVFRRLRDGAQSGLSLLRSLSPRLAAVLPSALPGGASSSSSGDSDSDSDSDSGSGSGGSSGSSTQSFGARFLGFARRLLTTMFNFITSAFRTVRGFFSSGGAGAGVVSGIRDRVQGLLGRRTTTTEAPDYDSPSEDDGASESDSGSISSGSADAGSSSSETGGFFSSPTPEDIDIRDNEYTPPKEIPPIPIDVKSMVTGFSDLTFKPMPSFPGDNVKPSGSSGSSGAGYSDSSMSSSSAAAAAGSSGYSGSSSGSSSSSGSQGGYSSGGSTGTGGYSSGGSTGTGGYSSGGSTSSGGYSSGYNVAPATYSSPSYYSRSPYVVHSPSFYVSPLVY